MIEYLELRNFRNFRENSFSFNSPDMVLTGPNGSGKTSLLEALGYLSILRSFRGARSKELVTLGEHGFELNCRCRTGKVCSVLGIRESSEGKRQLFIRGASPLRTSDFIKEFRCVSFVPEDREIVSGASGCRRRFFDMMISSIDHSYLKSLSDFNRALMQRNRALKSSKPHVAAHFDTELAERTPEIVAKRMEYARIMETCVNDLLKETGSTFEIRYLTAGSLESEQNLFLLRKNLEKDMQRKCTVSGPQLDEFEFRLDNKIMRSFCSTGQKGIVALMLKMAEFTIVREKSSVPVVILADDVLCDLDRRNSELFLERIKSADQRFFTFAGIPSFGNFREYETIEL